MQWSSKLIVRIIIFGGVVWLGYIIFVPNVSVSRLGIFDPFIYQDKVFYSSSYGIISKDLEGNKKILVNIIGERERYPVIIKGETKDELHFLIGNGELSMHMKVLLSACQGQVIRDESHLIEVPSQNKTEIKKLQRSPQGELIQYITNFNNNESEIYIGPNFNLKRNFFIRSITPHGVSDSLNICVVYC